MRLKNNFIVILLIVIVSYGLAWTSEPANNASANEYFIIGTNAMLYGLSDTGTKLILLINEFDKVTLLNLKSVNDRYNVSLNGTNGWVDVLNVSVVPEGWVKINRIEGIYLYLPKDFNFKFENGELVTNGGNSNYSFEIEYKIYDNQRFLDIYHNLNDSYVHSHSSFISNFVKINYYGNVDGYYYGGNNLENGNKALELTVDNELKKENYICDITLTSDNPSYEEEITAKKILFSVRIKDANHSSEQPLSDQPGQTYTLTGDNVNVRVEAATNGAVLVKLSKGAKVTLLKRSDIALTVGDKKGFWAYVDTQVTNKDGERSKAGCLTIT